MTYQTMFDPICIIDEVELNLGNTHSEMTKISVADQMMLIGTAAV